MYDIVMTQNDNNVIPLKRKIRFINCFIIYLKMSFLKASPEELPADWSCAIKALAIYFSINLLLLDVHSSTFDTLLKIMVEIGLLAIFVKIGNNIKKTPERFIQTLSGLIGIGMIISIVSVPIYYLFIPQFSQQQELNQGIINLTILLLIWNLAVMSHIFKRSFEITTLMASVISFNYLIVFEIIIISLSSGSA